MMVPMGRPATTEGAACMKKKWIHTVSAILAGLAMVLVALPVPTGYAYVLEGPHIIDLMTQTLGEPKTLRVQQRVTIEDDMISEAPLELTETVSYLFPGRFRSDAWYRTTNRVLVVSYGQALTLIDGKITSHQQSRYDLFKDPLLYRSRVSLLKALLSSGVDVGITSLGQLDQKAVFVIGAQYPDAAVSQLWVDKERFLPLRWVLVTPAGDETASLEKMEFSYINWQKSDKYWYPTIIESFRNGRLIRRIRVQDVMVDAKFSPELLSIAYLLKIYPSAEPGESAPQPAKRLDDVDRAIDDFKKKFEP